MVGLYLAQQLSDYLRSFLIGWSLSSETAERFSKTLDETAATLQKVKFTNINFTLVTIIFFKFQQKPEDYDSELLKRQDPARLKLKTITIDKSGFQIFIWEFGDINMVQNGPFRTRNIINSS